MEQPTNVTDLLRAMIAIETVTPRVSGRPDAERPLGEMLKRLAESWGWRTEWLPLEGSLGKGSLDEGAFGKGLASNLLVWPTASETLSKQNPSWLVFDSHLDTVGIQGMTIDPLGSDSTADTIFGRGACDTKGTGAAMLWALRQAADANTLVRPVAMLMTVGEEDQQIGARSFVQFDRPRLAKERGWQLDQFVVGEPTAMQVVATTGGFIRWNLTTHGIAAHSSRPHLGRNAIVAMASAVQALQTEHIDQLAETHPLIGPGSCSMNVIQGGTELNIVPESCTLSIDQRLLPGQSADEQLAHVAAVLHRLKQADPDFSYTLHDVETVVPLDLEANMPLGEWTKTVLRQAGIPSAITGEPYTTNANHLAAAGASCVILGPGEIAKAHTKEESIRVTELETGVRGYRALMETPLGT